MSCDWCVEGKCVTKDEATCDWKQLPMTKEAISRRMDEEREHIIFLCKEAQATKNRDKIFKNLNIITDITTALERMHVTLYEKFNTYKKIEDPIFGITLANTIVHSKMVDKLEQKKRERRTGK